MKRTKLWWARFETSHFTFDAFGTTRGEVLIALEQGWTKHAQQTGASLPLAEVMEEASVIQVHAGECLRDRDYDLNQQ